MVEDKKNETTKSYYGLKSALKIIEPEVMACNLPLRLDPYLGCGHNCTYCYARALKTIRNQWNPEAPKPIDVSLLEKYFSKVLSLRSPPKNATSRALWNRVPIRIGTDTDPFQPCERTFKVTKKVLEILNKNNYPYIITTKSDMIAEPEYIQLLKSSPAGVIVQFTIISLNEDLVKKLEPGAPTVSRRLIAMRKLKDEGIYTQTRISPIIPKLTDNKEDMETLIKTLKEAGSKDLIVEYLRYNAFIRNWMTSALGVESSYFDEIYIEAYEECSKSFPECCKLNKDRFGCQWTPRLKMINGYYRMPLRLKLEKYKEFKQQAESNGIRLFVCSEEFPEINNCVNCCGITGEEARKYLKFKYDNEACANNLACFIRKQGRVSAQDVLNNMFSIDKSTFKKQFENLDKYLVNVKRDDSGGWKYEEIFPV
ncbi:MAG: SPL family radical SAM protein [Thermoproteota archaeon]|jgi:DNA repair photolyase